MSSTYKARCSTNIIIHINTIYLLKLQSCKNKILCNFMEINTLLNVPLFHLTWTVLIGWEELLWDYQSHSTDSKQSLDFQAILIKGDKYHL